MVNTAYEDKIWSQYFSLRKLRGTFLLVYKSLLSNSETSESKILERRNKIEELESILNNLELQLRLTLTQRTDFSAKLKK